MNSKGKKYLIYGIIGAILTMIGDCLLCGADTTGAAGGIGRYAVIAGKISYTRIGLGAFFGFIGIPVSVFGYYVLYESLKEKDSTAARLYKTSLYGYVALGGAIHVICCYIMTGIKKDLETGTAAESLLGTLLKEQGGYIIPCMIVFLCFYLMHCICMAVLVAKKKTGFPAWMWILNPLTCKLLINIIGRFGSSAAANGILCSNMSLGALLIFAVWWIYLSKGVAKDGTMHT